MDMGYLSAKIGKWYQHNHRKLPWRKTRNPYRIWLSEIILQQTRVDQGLPYYRAFVRNFHSVHNLAAASEQRILRLWQGLGYYTRARNLLKCARKVVKAHGGKFPSTSHQLLELPGIGPYTAAAIASTAFGERVAVVDGNVTRVLSRFYGVRIRPDTTRGRKLLARLALESMGSGPPGIHNQAMMEFGALHCKPVEPACFRCPVRRRCFAATHELQHRIPARKTRNTLRNRYFDYIVLRRPDGLVMRHRSQDDIWKGLFDFPSIEASHQTRVTTAVARISKTMRLHDPAFISPVYRAVLSHQVIHARFLVYTTSGTLPVPAGTAGIYSKVRVDRLPKPVLISGFLRDCPLF